jgi:ribosomal protein L37AE/L43A
MSNGSRRLKSPKQAMQWRCRSCGKPFTSFSWLEEHPCKKADAMARRLQPMSERMFWRAA